MDDRTRMDPVGQEEETSVFYQGEDAKLVRNNVLTFAEAFAAARESIKKTNFWHMHEACQSAMAIMLAEASARPDAPKTYREWRNWLFEEWKC